MAKQAANNPWANQKSQPNVASPQSSSPVTGGGGFPPGPKQPQLETDAPWGNSAGGSFQIMTEAPPQGPWDMQQKPVFGGAGPITATKAPSLILIGTYVGAIAGIICGLIASNIIIMVTGWVLGGLVALGFAMVYMLQNSKRQANPLYQYSKGPVLTYGVGVSLSLIAVVLCAAQIALYIGRL